MIGNTELCSTGRSELTGEAVNNIFKADIVTEWNEEPRRKQRGIRKER